MSLPKFPRRDETFTREEVINQILASIAMEEIGLSHIINAEGEKLQYALGTIPDVPGPKTPPSIDDLLKLNDSIRETLDSTAQNQMLLKSKMQHALSAPVTQGSAGTFQSSYAEALANKQDIEKGKNVVFDAAGIDIVGKNIKLDKTGTIFTITRTGLYHIEWNLNITSEINPGDHAVVGILENGKTFSKASCSASGEFSSGTLIQVGTVPFTISLHNFGDKIFIGNPDEWKNSAGSIRIVRFADGPNH